MILEDDEGTKIKNMQMDESFEISEDENQLDVFNPEVSLKHVCCEFLKNLDRMIGSKQLNTSDSELHSKYEFHKYDDFINLQGFREIVEKELKPFINIKDLQSEITKFGEKSIQAFTEEGYISAISPTNIVSFIDKRNDIKEFILDLIRNAEKKSIHFEKICQKIQSKEQGGYSLFYNKDYIHNQIDQLFQNGQIFEDKTLWYQIMD